MHEAFVAAAEIWPREGLPKNPRAWLVSTGRFKAIDLLRRRVRFDDARDNLLKRSEEIALANTIRADEEIEDDRLRLIFTCCHPAIAPATQIALTLREVCDLKTEEIASAFLTSPVTMAQRIVRGKAKIRDAKIPFIVPLADNLPERIDSVLSVIYLVFNEGYSASSGDVLTRKDLSEEAIRLGRLLVELLPVPEAIGLLALMLLQESRRLARSTPEGDLILLEDQDRALWNHEQIREGQGLVERALSSGRIGAYGIQAAIAAVHASAKVASMTDWAQVVALYDTLLVVHASPVVELNRAVAVAMSRGPAEGLVIIDGLLARGDLHDYHLLHAARADLLRRLGNKHDAVEAYKLALQWTQQDPEKRFLISRIESLTKV